MIVTFDVPRSRYLFGHRKAVEGGAVASAAGPLQLSGGLAEIAGSRPVFGIAIASRSEVRAVRVCFDRLDAPTSDGGSSTWLEVVEGAPVVFGSPIAKGMVLLDRLDAHDGRLTLAIATTAESAMSLPVDVVPEGAVVIGANEKLLSTSGDALKVHLAPPRVSVAGSRKFAAAIQNTHGSVAGALTLYGLARHSRSREIELTSAALLTAEVLTAGAITEIAETEIGATDHVRCELSGASGVSLTGRLVLR